jgi:hypothetical protein
LKKKSEPNLVESNDSQSVRNKNQLSFSIRELLLLVVIAALVIMYFLPRDRTSTINPSAPFQISSPIEYRYWHQRGASGSGTGQIGSGNEWRPAIGIEVFDNFVILHLEDGVDRMIEREGLQWFDWRRVEESGNASIAAPVAIH